MEHLGCGENADENRHQIETGQHFGAAKGKSGYARNPIHANDGQQDSDYTGDQPFYHSVTGHRGYYADPEYGQTEIFSRAEFQCNLCQLGCNGYQNQGTDQSPAYR